MNRHPQDAAQASAAGMFHTRQNGALSCFPRRMKRLPMLHLLLAIPFLLALLTYRSSAQNFFIEAHVIAGGGGVSSNAQFHVSGIIGGVDSDKMSGENFEVHGSVWNLLMPPQIPGTPSLVVRRLASTVQVSWADEVGAFVLQETSSLDGSTRWSDSAATPTLMDGEWVVRLPTQSSLQFFRLAAKVPTLVTRQVGSNIEITWPSRTGPFVLEESTSLTETSLWSNVRATPTFSNGRFVVWISQQAGTRFFRLRGP